MIYAYDFAHDYNYPLSASGAKVVVGSPQSGSQTIQVPDDPVQHRYWLIGCFKGTEELSNFQVKNRLMVTNPNAQLDLCE